MTRLVTWLPTPTRLLLLALCVRALSGRVSASSSKTPLPPLPLVLAPGELDRDTDRDVDAAAAAVSNLLRKRGAGGATSTMPPLLLFDEAVLMVAVEAEAMEMAGPPTPEAPMRSASDVVAVRVCLFDRQK